MRTRELRELQMKFAGANQENGKTAQEEVKRRKQAVQTARKKTTVPRRKWYMSSSMVIVASNARATRSGTIAAEWGEKDMRLLKREDLKEKVRRRFSDQDKRGLSRRLLVYRRRRIGQHYQSGLSTSY